MTIFDSNVSVFKITDTSAAERDVSADIVSIEGLPGPRELSEATTLGQTGRKWYPTLQNGTFTLELLFDDAANTGSDTVFGPLRTHTAATVFKYGPKGGTGGLTRYTGSCWVSNYTILTRVGDLVKARVELKVDGVVTRDTF